MQTRPLIHRSGFTYIDLLAILLVIAIFSGVSFAVVNRAQETRNRVMCASHLRMIGQALLLYANENNGNFPRTYYDRKGEKVTAYTGYAAKVPFGAGGPEANDVTAPIYLLIRTQDLGPEAFVCPSSGKPPLDFGIKPLPPGARAATQPAAFAAS